MHTILLLLGRLHCSPGLVARTTNTPAPTHRTPTHPPTHAQGFAASNKLGAGGYGPVYRGTLDGVPVAVKLLDTSGRGSQGVAEFQAEVGILSRLHHPHIVLLMGCCPARCALVYELLDHGSLEQHLFNPALPELAWQVRRRDAAAADCIAAGSRRQVGGALLHPACGRACVRMH